MNIFDYIGTTGEVGDKFSEKVRTMIRAEQEFKRTLGRLGL